jgi:hypothetical protein
MDENENGNWLKDAQKELERIVRKREDLELEDWTPPIPPPEPEEYGNYALGNWHFSARAHGILSQRQITLDDLRREMPERLWQYVLSAAECALLVRVAAGGGKTYAGIELAQRAARSGMRVLWTSARHNAWDDLVLMRNFDGRLWYHWLPIQFKDEDTDAEMCRLRKAQEVWQKKGYSAFELCKRLCWKDGWINSCPYRGQENRTEPIIFAMHNHLANGIAISGFDLVIVDELPLKAFIQERTISEKGVVFPNAYGPIEDLTQKLAETISMVDAGLYKRRLGGRDLFEIIGPYITDALAQLEVMASNPIQIPTIYHPEDVKKAPYWYLLDLLEVCLPEHKAWLSGWERWAERLWIDKAGLHILKRSDPWDKLPKRMVVLDATAKAEIYKAIFDREIEEYRPNIARQGRVFQVAGRLNGKRDLLDKNQEIARAGKQAIETVQSIVQEKEYTGRVSVICSKDFQPFFSKIYGDDNVRHFYDLRGTNSLEGCQVLFVVGTPSPRGQSVIDAATALSKRIQPFGKPNETGYIEPVFVRDVREYMVTADFAVENKHRPGYCPSRKIGGFWNDPDLQIILDQMREAELLQAIHRARINVHDVDVWLLSSVPIDEPVDGIFNDPPIGPDGINWRVWLKLKPWLEEKRANGETVTYESLAGAIIMPRKVKGTRTRETADKEVSNDFIKNHKWLEKIVAYWPDGWNITSIQGTGRGRPKTGIAPK